jgi:hypothetical protein
MRIVAPCGEDWEAMEGSGAVRFCARCRREVTDIDLLEVEDVRALLQRGPACVRGRTDPMGRLLRVVALAAAGTMAVGAPSLADKPVEPVPVEAPVPPVAPIVTPVTPPPAELDEHTIELLQTMGYAG